MKLLASVFLSLLAFAAQAKTVLISWTAPTTNTDGTAIVGPITYTVYQYTNAVSTQLATGVVGLTFTTLNLPPGKYSFQVSAWVNGMQSVAATSPIITIAAPPPNPPTAVTAI